MKENKYGIRNGIFTEVVAVYMQETSGFLECL
jgi:hypothetical protein